MGGVIDKLFGGGRDAGAALAGQQIEMAQHSQELALAGRLRQEAAADMELARRPRGGRGRKLLQYYGEDAQSLGGA